MMTAKYNILGKYIKDLSGEHTSDIETFLFVRDNISKYHTKYRYLI